MVADISVIVNTTVSVSRIVVSIAIFAGITLLLASSETKWLSIVRKVRTLRKKGKLENGKKGGS